MSYAVPSSQADSVKQAKATATQVLGLVPDSPSLVFDLTGPLDLTEGLEPPFDDFSNRYDDLMDIPRLRT